MVRQQTGLGKILEAYGCSKGWICLFETYVCLLEKEENIFLGNGSKLQCILHHLASTFWPAVIQALVTSSSGEVTCLPSETLVTWREADLCIGSDEQDVGNRSLAISCLTWGTAELLTEREIWNHRDVVLACWGSGCSLTFSGRISV